MNHPAALSRRTERDPVRHIADLVSGGLELEAESELISLAESRTLDAATRCQLARLSLQIEKPHLARGILEAALKSAPRSTDVRFLCGLAEKALGHLHESLEHFALAAPETNPDAAYYVSIVHEELGHLEKARQAIEWALAIAPEDADYLNQSACVLAHLGEHEQALAASDAALSMEPQSAGLALNHAHNLLLHGRYAEAWPLYEARLAFTPDHLPPRNGSAPWEGQSLEGKSLLVWHEQGLGDTIHFARFVLPLLNIASRVILRTPTTLQRLLASALPGITVVAEDAPLPSTDFHAPLLSLPGIAGFDGSVWPVPLLSITPSLPQSGLLPRRIGFVCGGNPLHPDDVRRSVPLAQFLPLLDARHEWVCLQKRKPLSRAWPDFVQYPTLHFANFYDTATAVRSLDLVISADTAVAHLSASCGIPTWVLLPHTPDWRWGLGRETTPWYPAARLFRQPSPGDWRAVIQAVQKALL